MKPNKEFKDWDFNELVDALAWDLVQGLLRGQYALVGLLRSIIQTALYWKDEQDKKAKKDKKSRKRKP